MTAYQVPGRKWTPSQVKRYHSNNAALLRSQKKLDAARAERRRGAQS